jgi:hypothetical protein
MAAGPTSMPTCPASRETDSLSELRPREIAASVWRDGTMWSHLPEDFDELRGESTVYSPK